MRTIAFINRKGGCGKSTTAVGVAATLAELGQRVLLIDLDPQGSSSSWLAAGPTDDESFHEAFIGTRDLADLAAPSRAAGVDLVSASSSLVTAERSLQVDLALGAIRALERLPTRTWDTVVIDCPPTLGYLASAALCGVREVIIPTQAHALDVPGIESVIAEMTRIQVRLNPELTLTGIVVGRVSRTNHARNVAAALRAAHGRDVFDQTIRDSTRVPEAAAAGLPVTVFAPDSPVAADIRAVAAEVIRRDPSERPGEPERASGWRGVFDRFVGARG
jgi:chromosome partitioning protein